MPETKQEAIFTAEDHLRLLQLMTRRVIAERRNRDQGAGGQILRAESADWAQVTDSVIPSKWRLVPEGVELYEWQRRCLPLWLAKGRGTVKVATGGGKTLFALVAAQDLQNTRAPDLRLVIVVPTIPLMFQWLDEIMKGNLPRSAIGLLGGSQETPPLSGLRVLISVLNSARERLPALARQAQWSNRMMLVVDECHRANAEQARRIFDSNPAFTLGLSATPEQDAEAEGLPTDEAYARSPVGQGLGPVIFEFSLKESLEAGLLTPFEVWHIGLPLSGDEAAEHAKLSRDISDLRKTLQRIHSKSRSKQGFLAWCQTQVGRSSRVSADAQRFIGLANSRKRLLYRASARIELTLAVLAEACTDPETRSIVFHESIDEIEQLYLRAVEQGIPAVLEHSRLPDGLRGENIEAFRKGTARSIVSAKSLVEGFNVPSADLGIISASSGSVRQRIQSLGRMLRRKPGDRQARIIVLYMRDTEDESIYEKADWEQVIGAERNRYFHWEPAPEGNRWEEGLTETNESPRAYRPPSFEVDVRGLTPGNLYPGKPDGMELRVDQEENLRTPDELLVPAPRDLISQILAYNPHRRAHRTAAGHLIVRADPSGAKEADWRFLGLLELPDAPADPSVRELRIMSVSGRREIAEKQTGRIRFARGPEQSRTPESGRARNVLLQWVREIECRRGITVKTIHWDGAHRYWLEIQGERIDFPDLLPRLEFAE